MFLLLFALLFSSPKAEPTSRLYCFKNVNLKEVISYIDPILKKDDHINIVDQNCLEMRFSREREFLFDRWIKKKYLYKSTRSNMSDKLESPVGNHCRFKLSTKKMVTHSSGLGYKTESSGQSIHWHTLQVGKRSQIMIGKEITSLTCFKRKDDTFEIHLSIRSDDSKSKRLKTQFLATVGKEVLISDIIHKVKNRQIEISTKSLKLKRNKIKREETISFTLK